MPPVLLGLSEEIEEEGVLTLRMMLFRDRRFGSPFPTDNNTQMIVVNLGRMIYVEITEAHVVSVSFVLKPLIVSRTFLTFNTCILLFFYFIFYIF